MCSNYTFSDKPVHSGVDTQVQARIPLGCDENCVCVHPGTVCRLADPWVAIVEPRPKVMSGSGYPLVGFGWRVPVDFPIVLICTEGAIGWSWWRHVSDPAQSLL